MAGKKKYKGFWLGNEGSPSDKMASAGKSLYEHMSKGVTDLIERFDRGEDMSKMGQELVGVERLNRKMGDNRKNARARAVKATKRSRW